MPCDNFVYKVFEYDANGKRVDTNKELHITKEDIKQYNIEAHREYANEYPLEIDGRNLPPIFLKKIYGFTVNIGIEMNWKKNDVDGDMMSWDGNKGKYIPTWALVKKL